MKITLPARSLKSLLGDVLRLGTGDATHPGFGLMHLEATKKGVLRATVINAQAAVRMARVDVNEGHGPGAVALTLRIAENISSVLPNGDEQVSLMLVDGGPGRMSTLRVQVEGMLVKMPTQPLENLVPFPTPPGAEAAWHEVSGATLVAIARHVAWCCAPPSDIARPTLQGVHVMPSYVEASDGHRLVRLMTSGFVPENIVLPKAIIDVMASLVGDAKVRVAIDTQRLWVQAPTFMLTCRVVEGAYPDVDAMGMFMTPGDDGLVMDYERKMVRASGAEISQAAMMIAAENMTKVFERGAKDDRPVLKFLVRNQDMNVIMTSESGTAVDIAHKIIWRADDELVPNEESLKQLNSILLDAQYVASVLSHMPKTDFVKMTWISALNRIQFQAGDMMAVVMPRRH